MIKLLVLNCVFICCTYGDSEARRHNTTISIWMVSPYIAHIDTQFSTSNFISFYFFTYILNLSFKT